MIETRISSVTVGRRSTQTITLAPGDDIRPGDEYQDSEGRWRPTELAGRTFYPDRFLPHRRVTVSTR